MDYSNLKRYFGINIPDEKIQSALSHSSIQKLSIKQRQYNDYLVIYGYHCLNAAIYLYLFTKSKITSDNLITSNTVTSLRTLIRDDIYNSTNLEKYILKSKGEENNRHTKMVYQLIGLIASELNIITLYKKIYKFINSNIDKYNDIDYKSQLRYFADKHKLKYSVTILSESGPDHNKDYEVCLSVGERSVRAHGKSKKNAEKEAAILFCKKYNIQFDKKTFSENSFKRIQIEKRRQYQLVEAAKKLNVSTKDLSFYDLDVAFTTKQFTNDYKYTNHVLIQSNSYWSLLGGQVLPLYCIDYIIKNIKKYDDINELKSNISSVENLSDTLLTYYDYLRINSKSSTALSIYSKKTLCYESIKAIVGLLSYKMICSENILLYTKGYQIFASLINDSNVTYTKPYTNILTQIAQAIEGSVSYSILNQRTLEKNIQEIEINAVFTAKQKSFSAKAKNRSVFLAKNRASLSIFEDIKKNSDILIGADKKKIKRLIKSIPNDIKEMMINGDTELKKYLISNHGMYLQFFKEADEETCILAVEDNPLAIQFIDNPSTEIQLAVVKSKNKQAIDMLEITDEIVWTELLSIYPEYIIKIDNPTIRQQTIYNEKIIETNKQARKASTYLGLSPYDEESFLRVIRSKIQDAIISSSAQSILLDNRIPTSSVINELVKTLNPSYAAIAVGFLFESGLGMLKTTFNTLKNNNVKTTMIVGTLQNYDIVKKDNSYVEQMDRNTAVLLNKYISEGLIELRTYSELFYHGKYYYFSNNEIACVIIGSSNISASGLKKNRELNILNIFPVTNEDNRLYYDWFNKLKSECQLISHLDLSLFKNKDDNLYDELSETDVKSKIEMLTDKQQQERLNMWISKHPHRIIKLSKSISNAFKAYIVFEYPQYNLLALESFESGNAFYCFRTSDIEVLKKDLKDKNKIQMCLHPLFLRRGYHSSDTLSLMLNINSIF